MVDLILQFFSNFLIEFMSLLLGVALSLRWFSYTHSKRDEAYFSHFTRELSSTINEDKQKNVSVSDVESYLINLLGRVNQKLPHRNLRADLSKRKEKMDIPEENSPQSVSLREYVGSKHGLIASIQNETSVFNTKTPPNFGQLTERVMNEDDNWSKLFGFMPIDGVTRILDVLPTIFIVLGVFGTFIGISMALPEIAAIDFSNLEASGDTLSQFVLKVTFAMKTSIAGIFFSIILTFLNTLFPIEATRESTFDKVENVMQVLWYHVQKDSNKKKSEELLNDLSEKLGQIVELLGSGAFKKAS
jgi:hypothetical protein